MPTDLNKALSRTPFSDMAGQLYPAGTLANDQHQDDADSAAQLGDGAHSGSMPTFADNQPLDAETAKEYDVVPGTTWRVVHVGQKLGALWRAVGAGTATREQALSFRNELSKLRTAPDLSIRELQEARTFAGIYSSLANSSGKFTTDEIVGDPLYADYGLGMPSGGGAGRLPGAPFEAGTNMIRPGDLSAIRLNQAMGLSLPRSPLPRNLPAPPAKRGP